MTDWDRRGSRSIPFHAQGAEPAGDPISLLEAEHASLLALCDVLEQIADRLPNHVSRKLAGLAASQLAFDLQTHIRFEEDDLFPLLRERAFLDYPIRSILKQLEREHEADETYAQEIAEELRIIADNGDPRNAEMLGYMLRGFFDSQRRHIQWENALLLPIAREVLQPSDLDRLSRRLAARASQRPKAAGRRDDQAEHPDSEPDGAKIIPLWR